MNMSIGNQRAVTASTFRSGSAPAIAATTSSGTNGLEGLTTGDFELVYQATGLRVTKDSPTAPVFAAIIASQRRTGAIPDGQPVSAKWLRELADSARNLAGDERLAGQADMALQYLLNGHVAGRQTSL